MTFSEARAASRNPGAFVSGEGWMVRNSATGEPIQSDHSQNKAERSANILNEHEKRNNRPAVYVAEQFT
jgi:hypothetical protein